jgi:[acyl-carrier-protein] S-malonyltransferase
VEVGGKVVGPMIKRSAGDVDVTSVLGMEDVEALAKAL